MRNKLFESISDSLAYDLLGESKPVLDEEDEGTTTVDPSTTVDYFTMPATVVVLRKGDGTQCVQEIPIGQIKQFKFVNYKELDSFWEPKKNIDKYKDFTDKYSKSKSNELNKWMKDPGNKATVESAMKLQGYVGFDVIPNKSKLDNPEPEEKPIEKPIEKPNEKPNEAPQAQSQEGNKTVTEVEAPEKGPEAQDPETKGPEKEISKDMTRNMKVVAKALQDKDVQKDISDVFTEKVEASGKESQIDNKIRGILSETLGEEGYRDFQKNGQADVMKWLESQPKKVQKDLLEKLEGLKDFDQGIAVGIGDIRKEVGNDKEGQEFVKAAAEIADEKGRGTVDETLWTGIISMLSGLFNVAWGVLQLFFAHPLAMTGIAALFYIAYKGRKGGKWHW